ncbi:MAG: hypothetical protein ACHQTE_00820 [Candidatus Saccharimonadales bacterium]
MSHLHGDFEEMTPPKKSAEQETQAIRVQIAAIRSDLKFRIKTVEAAVSELREIAKLPAWNEQSVCSVFEEEVSDTQWQSKIDAVKELLQST